MSCVTPIMIKGNPDKFARFMLLAVSEEAKTSFPFCFWSMYNKQLSDSVFVTSKITAEGLGKVYGWFGFCDIQNNCWGSE